MPVYQYNGARITTYSFRKTADVFCRLTPADMSVLQAALGAADSFGSKTIRDLYCVLTDAVTAGESNENQTSINAGS